MKKATVRFKHMSDFFDTMAKAKGPGERYEVLGHKPCDMSNCSNWTIKINTMPYEPGDKFVSVEVVTTLNN